MAAETVTTTDRLAAIAARASGIPRRPPHGEFTALEAHHACELARTDAPDLVAALRRVREIHRPRPVTDRDVSYLRPPDCSSCVTDESYLVPWPCEHYLATLLPGESA